ncbi:MAG: TetR/AcrR family transcriptional regulator [Rubrivivax sp.]|nr:MAG: TetR/AcrR family transcriptional regulator [Rubrivivax sp.]
MPAPEPNSSADRSQLDQAQRLLDAAVEHFLAHGFSDGSLRSMAEHLNTSHRMLSYYFGSSEGFWDALLSRLRKMDQAALARSAAQGVMPSLAEAWADVSAEGKRPFFRLMFGVYGKALADPARFQGFLDQVVGSWIDVISEGLVQQHGLPKAEARIEARLQLATLRGLLLDLLTTHDHAGTTAALNLFARRMSGIA